MKKICASIVFILFICRIQAQDWLQWNFQYDFKLEQKKLSNFHLDSFAVSINVPFNSNKLTSSTLSLNDNTSIYSLNMYYGCISCGYDALHLPPTIFITCYLYDRFQKETSELVIPVSFDSIPNPHNFQKNDSNSSYLTKSSVYFDLQTIYFDDFIFFNTSFVKYDGIRIKSTGELYRYTNQEYPFPLPEKLFVNRITFKT